MKTPLKPVAVAVFGLLAAAGSLAWGQRRPESGPLPEPRPDMIEVRFAVGERELPCRHFRLIVRVGQESLISGRFSSEFRIPAGVAELPRKDAVDIELQCGGRRWHFANVSERALLRGWWWVGIDYPPFPWEWERNGSPELKGSSWIKYLTRRSRNQTGAL